MSRLIIMPMIVGCLFFHGACANRMHNHLGETMNAKEAEKNFRANFTYMADNAAMQDSSIADIHFIPHTSEISSTGIHRLDRMAGFLKQYGGMVRYDTPLTDEEMINTRLMHVHEYLESIGCDMSRIQIKTMMAGGRGLTAEDAIAIRQRGTAVTSTGTNASAVGGAGGGNATQ